MIKAGNGGLLKLPVSPVVPSVIKMLWLFYQAVKLLHSVINPQVSWLNKLNRCITNLLHATVLRMPASFWVFNPPFCLSDVTPSLLTFHFLDGDEVFVPTSSSRSLWAMIRCGRRESGNAASQILERQSSRWGFYLKLSLHGLGVCSSSALKMWTIFSRSHCNKCSYWSPLWFSCLRLGIIPTPYSKMKLIHLETFFLE